MTNLFFNQTATYNIKARLRRDNFANFLSYYHDNNASTDFFYKTLLGIITKHKLATAASDDEFISPMTPEGFSFKQKNTICKKKQRVCLITDILDNDVTMKLKIIPYDFFNNKRIVGVSIQVLQVVVSSS